MIGLAFENIAIMALELKELLKKHYGKGCLEVEGQRVEIPPGARVRPPTNYWVSYQPTIGYLTNQLLGILPTNYWVSYQPTIGCLTNQLTTFLLSIFPPPWQPMLLMIQVQVQHSFYQFSPPLGNPCLVLGFRF